MRNEQILVGVLLAFVCLLGFWKTDWFLANTRKGQRLVRWFGLTGAKWAWRVFMAFGLVAGCLLAANIIRPIQW